VKTGSGTLTLTASNSYTGNTRVNGGTLVVSGNISASGTAIVNNNAMLNGAGTVGTLLVAGGGTLRPGLTSTTTAILTATGPVTLGDAGLAISRCASAAPRPAASMIS